MSILSTLNILVILNVLNAIQTFSSLHRRISYSRYSRLSGFRGRYSGNLAWFGGVFVCLWVAIYARCSRYSRCSRCPEWQSCHAKTGFGYLLYTYGVVLLVFVHLLSVGALPPHPHQDLAVLDLHLRGFAAHKMPEAQSLQVNRYVIR